MNKSIRVSIAVAVVSAMTLFTGCGSNKSAPSKSVSSEPSPKVPAGSMFAAYCAENGIKDTATCREMEKITKDLPFVDDVDCKFVKDLTKGKICGKEPKWAVMSIGEIKRPKHDEWDKVKFPALSYAIRVDVTAAELKKAIEDLCEDCDVDECEIEKINVDGIEGYKVVVDEDDLEEKGVSPCFASVADKILVLASSEKALSSVIALYTGKAESDPAFASLIAPLGTGECGRLLISKVGSRVKKLLPSDALDDLCDEQTGIAQQLVDNLGDVMMVFSVDDAEKAEVIELTLDLSDSKVADDVKKLCKSELKDARRDTSSKTILSILKGIDVSANGGSFTLKVSLPVRTIKKLIDGQFGDDDDGDESPRFSGANKAKQTQICIDNLRQLEGALEQARMVGFAVPADDDIFGADNYIKVKPVCPYNKKPYVLPTEAGGRPTCPNVGVCPDHKLPSYDDEY